VIKAVIGPVSNPTVLLGISGENITRLMADEPILINLKDLHDLLPNVNILLIAGHTEESLKVTLEEGRIKHFDFIEQKEV